MTLQVERTLDVGFILSVLTQPEILDSISEDGFKIEDFKIDVINHYWVGIYDGQTEIGVIQFRPMYKNCFDSHIHILPKYRKEYSQDAGAKILEWVSNNLGESLLYTGVPAFCESVKKFLLGFQFKEVGTLENAWLKNGVQNDMFILTKRIN